MKIQKRKNCPYFKPMPETPYMLVSEPSCSHCAYFSSRNCRRHFFDALEYPDDDI